MTAQLSLTFLIAISNILPQLKFLHMTFAPEAQRILAGGGAERNHRNRVEIYSGAPEGRQNETGLSPLRGWEYISTRFRWLRCAPPPANIRCASSAKDMCRNCSWTVCATASQSHGFNQTASWGVPAGSEGGGRDFNHHKYLCRKVRVRSSRGELKITSGEPLSINSPSASIRILSATSRANLIS